MELRHFMQCIIRLGLPRNPPSTSLSYNGIEADEDVLQLHGRAGPGVTSRLIRSPIPTCMYLCMCICIVYGVASGFFSDPGRIWSLKSRPGTSGSRCYYIVHSGVPQHTKSHFGTHASYPCKVNVVPIESSKLELTWSRTRTSHNERTSRAENRIRSRSFFPFP
jgi:hypothetical protein